MKRSHLFGVLISVTLIAAASAFAVVSFHARDHADNNFITRQDPANAYLSQADDYFLDGKRGDAVICVDSARDKALAEIQNPERQAQLVACAMSYCGYDQKNKAIAVLQRVVGFKDKPGQEAREILDGIARDDPTWRPRPMPDAATRARLRAMKAQMLNNPPTAKGFVNQYVDKH